MTPEDMMDPVASRDIAASLAQFHTLMVISYTHTHTHTHALTHTCTCIHIHIRAHTWMPTDDALLSR
jgi:hypothetical protein